MEQSLWNPLLRGLYISLLFKRNRLPFICNIELPRGVLLASVHSAFPTERTVLIGQSPFYFFDVSYTLFELEHGSRIANYREKP